MAIDLTKPSAQMLLHTTIFTIAILMATMNTCSCGLLFARNENTTVSSQSPSATGDQASPFSFFTQFMRNQNNNNTANNENEHLNLRKTTKILSEPQPDETKEFKTAYSLNPAVIQQLRSFNPFGKSKQPTSYCSLGSTTGTSDSNGSDAFPQHESGTDTSGDSFSQSSSASSSSSSSSSSSTSSSSGGGTSTSNGSSSSSSSAAAVASSSSSSSSFSSSGAENESHQGQTSGSAQQNPKPQGQPSYQTSQQAEQTHTSASGSSSSTATATATGSSASHSYASSSDDDSLPTNADYYPISKTETESNDDLYNSQPNDEDEEGTSNTGFLSIQQKKSLARLMDAPKRAMQKVRKFHADLSGMGALYGTDHFEGRVGPRN